jgi:catechol 2,3-dioxygenase-like lactoylglutathione lyase family enzyme
MRLEVVVIPVSDVERAKDFYGRLGWRLDADDEVDDGFRVVQFTPPGSACSVIFGTNVTSAVPGSVRDLHLVVPDVEATRAELVERGVGVSDVFHDAGPLTITLRPFRGVAHHGDREAKGVGQAPSGSSYSSFASFQDPDGNGWVLQEVTRRRPGRVDADSMNWMSAAELSAALCRAAAAFREHEVRDGRPDPDWPDWFAEHVVRGQAGEAEPS